MTRTTYDKGLWAETLAVLLLRLKGYRILSRRFKTPFGEIDVIARRGKTVAFIEVKQRPDLTQALEAVTPFTQARIRQAATLFLQRNPALAVQDQRFDVIAYCPPFLIRHLDNVQMTGA